MTDVKLPLLAGLISGVIWGAISGAIGSWSPAWARTAQVPAASGSVSARPTLGSASSSVGASSAALEFDDLPGEKLPVDLPDITVIGHREHPAATSGHKLAPDSAAEAMALPPPPPTRATNDFLSQMQLAVPAPHAATAELEGPGDRQPFTQIWGELGGLPVPGNARFDFGLSHGRELGPALSLTDVRAYSNGLDQWSILTARESLSWSPTTFAQLAWRRNQETPGRQTALQEGGSADAQWTQDRLELHVGADVGHVQVWPVEAQASDAAGLASSVDDTWLYDLAARATYRPALDWPSNAVKLDVLLGQQGLSETGLAGWSAPHVSVGALDRWAIAPRWALSYGLAASTLAQASYLDPSVKIAFQPGGEGHDSPADVWLAARTTTDLPNFAALYQDRLDVAGNGDLRPERTQPEAELGASERFSDRFYAQAALAYGEVLDFVYFAPTPYGLWQPRNFRSWQGVYDLKASGQYLWSDGFIEHFDLGIQDAAGLGQTLESIGTSHESSWLGGKLTIQVGTSLQDVQLGRLQATGSRSGMAWLAHWQVGYAIAPGWQLYASGTGWNVLAAEQPAPGYFAAPALATGGLEVAF